MTTAADDGTMTADLAQFDLAHEMAEFEHHKPWPKGIHAKTLWGVLPHSRFFSRGWVRKHFALLSGIKTRSFPLVRL
jgi:hypothetical protein